MNKDRFFRTSVSALTAMAFVMSACSGSGSPPASNPPEQGQKKPAPTGGQQANNDQGKSGNSTTASKNGTPDTRTTTQNNQPPSQPVPKSASIPAVLNPDDNVSYLLTKLFMEEHPDAIEQSREGLVNEVFSNEDEASGKIVEIQALIGRLARSGLYSPQVKDRVAYLQSGMVQRVQDDQYTDVLEKGVFFVAGGAVLGILAGTGAYRYVPEIPGQVKAAASAARIKIRDTVSAASRATSESLANVRAAVLDAEKRQATINATRQAFVDAKNKTLEVGQQAKDSTVQLGRNLRDTTTQVSRTARDSVVGLARRPFTPVSDQEMIENNLIDFGVTDTERTAMGPLQEATVDDLPPGTEFHDTAKGTFQFATVGEQDGQALGVERVIAFRQQRLVRGNNIETIMISRPVPADMAGTVAARLTTVPEQEPSRLFVHFMNLKTGTISALRWPLDKFTGLLSSANAKIQPLFLNLRPALASVDYPTAVGTAATTSAGMGIVYWYGFNNGQTNAKEAEVLDLEQMVPPSSAGVASLRAGDYWAPAR